MAELSIFWLLVVTLACGQVVDIWFNAEPAQWEFWRNHRWLTAGTKISNCPYCLSHYVALLCVLLWSSVSAVEFSAVHVVLLTLAVSRASWLLNQLLPVMLRYNRPKLIEDELTDDGRDDGSGSGSDGNEVDGGSGDYR